MTPASTGSTRRAAVVVAGGSSRRMGGVDKLALEVGGRTLFDRVLAAAHPLCDELVVVGPTRPTSLEGARFTMEDVPGGGPVPAVAAGLAVVHESATVVVLAADLPLLTTGHLERLFAAVSEPEAEAAAAVDERGRLHPLLAAHRVQALRARLDGLGPDLAGLPAARLLPPVTVAVHLEAEATLNVNRPADLERVLALIAAGEHDHWPGRYARALGLELTEAEVAVLLDLARDVAHGSERRFAPLSTFVAGRFVSMRVVDGVPVPEAMDEAIAMARSMLPGPRQP